MDKTVKLTEEKIKILVIEVTNPYLERTYKIANYDLIDWETDLRNIDKGNIQTVRFIDIDSGKYMSISPKGFASIAAYEDEIVVKRLEEEEK